MKFKNIRQHGKQAEIVHNISEDKYGNIHLTSIDLVSGKSVVVNNCGTALDKIKSKSEREILKSL